MLSKSLIIGSLASFSVQIELFLAVKGVCLSFAEAVCEIIFFVDSFSKQLLR